MEKELSMPEQERENIFKRHHFAFMIQHGLENDVMRTLNEAYTLKTITLIEKKPKTNGGN